MAETDFPLPIDFAGKKRASLSLRSTDLDADAKLLVIQAAMAAGRPLQAAVEMGYSPAAVQRALKDDAAFAEDFEAAVAFYVESRLETAADSRAVDGWLEPVFGKDGLLGEVRKFDSGLLKLRLEALAPQRYRPRQAVDLTVRAAGVLVLPSAAGGSDPAADGSAPGVAAAWSAAMEAGKVGD